MGVALGVIALIVVALLLAMTFGAVLVSIVGAMFLDVSLGTAWDLAWDHKIKLLIFVLFILPLFAFSKD